MTPAERMVRAKGWRWRDTLAEALADAVEAL